MQFVQRLSDVRLPMLTSCTSATAIERTVLPSRTDSVVLAIEPIDTSFSFKNKAYAALKNVIVSMDIYRSRTDIRLDERQLAQDLGISRTPVREAFGLLAAEGLIVVVPQRGSFVSQLRIDDILEIYQIRTPLECLAARIAAETIAYLRELADSGARLHGASDPAFKTINVLVEAT